MAAELDSPVPVSAKRSKVSNLLELTKPRITFFVVMTAFVGFAVGLSGPLATIDWTLLAHTMIGTALVASGTSAFNQIWEIDLDRKMARTASRPLPAGRLAKGEAIVFASLMSIAGIAELYFYVNPLTSLLAAATLSSYVLAYTPLKTRSTLSTLVGAIPGALPPLGGFTASHGSLAAPGWALFAILFLWQLPHFHAIGWRHRVDYGRAGVKILSTVDPSGRRIARHTLVTCLALFPVVLLPTYLGSAGNLYAVGAFVLTVCFLAAGIRFARTTTDANALTLFLVSIGWLPAVLFLLVFDRISG
ncbi:MAG: heme o synthase [Thermoanaerobaculia bacterium]